MLRNLALALVVAGMVYSAAPVIAQDNTAPAQEAGPPSGPAEHGHGYFDPARRADMLTKHLQLNSDQQAKVLDILKSAQSQMENLRNDTSTPREERRSKMMEIRKGADDQIRGILDPTQQKKFDQMQAHRQQWGHPGAGQQGNPPDASEQK